MTEQQASMMLDYLDLIAEMLIVRMAPDAQHHYEQELIAIRDQVFKDADSE